VDEHRGVQNSSRSTSDRRGIVTVTSHLVAGRQPWQVLHENHLVLVARGGGRVRPADDGHELGAGFLMAARRLGVATRSRTSDAYGWPRDDAERRAACSASGGSRSLETRSRAACRYRSCRRAVRSCPPEVAEVTILHRLSLLRLVA
jgi:hypothetical protein